MGGRWLLLALCWWMVAGTGWAGVPDNDLSIERRRWTLADGAPAQSEDATQTTDGLMWFTSPAGLYNFDGVKFQQLTAIHGEKLLSPSTSALYGLRQGGLAIGYTFGGISIFSPQGVRHFIAAHDFPLGTIRSVIEDADGVLYACTATQVLMLNGQRWVSVSGRSLSGADLYTVRVDADGTLWALGFDAVYAHRKGAVGFVQIMPSGGRGYANILGKALYVKGLNGEIGKLRGDGSFEPFKLEHPQPFVSLVEGPNDTVFGLRNHGLARLAQRPDGTWYELEFYPPGYGLDADVRGLSVYLDRDGNLWRTTFDGVEKLRLHRFHQLRGNDLHWLVRPGIGDEMWVGGRVAPMERLRPDGSAQRSPVLAPGTVLRVAPDHVWAGGLNGLWEFGPGGEHRWDGPEHLNGRFDVQAAALDDSGVLLVSLPRNGLWIFDHGAWRQDPRVQGLREPTPISMLRTAAGHTWVGLTNNRLGVLTPDALQLLPASAGLRIGNTLSMLDADGHLLIGGDTGVAWIDNGKVHEMKFRHRGNVTRVTGLVIDQRGQLWVHANTGLLLVSASELASFWRTPERPLAIELFNFEDGIKGIAVAVRPLPSLSIDGKGRVYYATASQVGWIDPADIRRNPRAPDVFIQSLRTVDGELQPVDGMKLPGRPTAVDLTFTATALSIPERVSIKYRLDGVDPDWQEVQRERSAHYTNLPPGSYHFQVIAANEDGVWNLQGAQLRFEILPAFWQTRWFHLLCLLMLILAGAAIYRWRIAVVRGRAELLADERAHARIEATLQERGRIARSLHDNLLQAVQALILRFHSVQVRMPQEPALQDSLDKVLTYAEELVASTRDEVVALRREPPCAELFAQLHKSLACAMPGAEALLVCTTAGEPKPLQELVAGELLYVMREAAWNSAKHGQASLIAVTLYFSDQALEGEVVDDGIGISAEHAADGAAGHWGIVGMRERMERLGGTLTIAAAEPHGVTVRFALQARQAYRNPA